MSIRAIATRAGCTAPAIYMHWSDKDELFFEVCSRRFREFGEAMRLAGEATDDPVESLRLQGQAYVDFALANPQQYRLLFMTRKHSPATVPDEDQPGLQAFDCLVQSVKRCIDSGDFRPCDPYMVAVGLWTGVHGLVTLLITAETFPWPDRQELIRHLLDTQMRGLAAAWGSF